jgi:ketosteroid isomerase-like protein
MRYAIPFLWAGAGAMLTLAADVVLADAGDGAVLKPGARMVRSIAARTIHPYTIQVRSGQAVRAVVDQRGVDVVIKVADPAGHVVGTFDSPNGDTGPEPVFFIAEKTGPYRLDVATLEPSANEGKYEIRLLEVRSATTREIATALAKRRIASAEKEWDDANVHADVKALDRLMSPDYVNLSRVDSSRNYGREAHLRNAAARHDRAMTSSPKDTIDDVTTEILGDTAVVTARVTATALVDNKPARNTFRFMHLWQHRPGGWKIVADQVIPAAAPPAARPVVTVSEAALTALEGIYLHSSGQKFTVKVSHDHLVMRGPAGEEALFYPESDSEFVQKGGGFHIAFVRDARGRGISAIGIDQGWAEILSRIE